MQWLFSTRMLEDSNSKTLVFFFFQAEDGIRDGHVTGVQTCALPISHIAAGKALTSLGRPAEALAHLREAVRLDPQNEVAQIGRASCRERVEISVVGGTGKKKRNLGLTKRNMC